MRKIFQLLWLLILLIAACSDTRPFIRSPIRSNIIERADPEMRPNHENVLTFFALGDWGTGEPKQREIAIALKNAIEQIPQGRKIAPFVLGLGDNVYESGLKKGWNNETTFKLLNKTFGEVYSGIIYEGKPMTFHIVPGNHDHAGVAGGTKFWGDVIHQETTAENLFPNWEYYPIASTKDTGLNDSTNYQTLHSENIFEITTPQKINIAANDLISIIAIDSQVLLNLYDNENKQLLKLHLQELRKLLREDTSWKIIIGHHPIRTHGKHGGFRKAIYWVPPIIIFTIIDKLFLSRLQDLDHRANKAFQRDMEDIMKENDVTFYFSGHEHNLQLIEIDSSHFQIISGSAAKLSEVTHKEDSIFSHAAHGFARFDVTPDEIWVEFFDANPKSNSLKSTALFKASKKN